MIAIVTLKRTLIDFFLQKQKKKLKLLGNDYPIALYELNRLK